MNNITLEQIQEIVLDAGVVYTNYGEVGQKILGATRGGNTFSTEPEYKIIERDGARGKEKGLRRLINLDVNLTVNLLSMSKDNLIVSLGSSKLTGDVISNKNEVEDTDYINNVTIIAKKHGDGYKRITVYNAFNDQGVEIGLEDKEENTIEVTFAGHFDPTDVTKPVYEIEDLLTIPDAPLV